MKLVRTGSGATEHPGTHYVGGETYAKYGASTNSQQQTTLINRVIATVRDWFK